MSLWHFPQKILRARLPVAINHIYPIRAIPSAEAVDVSSILGQTFLTCNKERGGQSQQRTRNG